MYSTEREMCENEVLHVTTQIKCLEIEDYNSFLLKKGSTFERKKILYRILHSLPVIRLLLLETNLR